MKISDNERLLTIIARIRETLTASLSEKFTALPEKDRINLQICLLHDLATRDKEVMRLVAMDVYEACRRSA